MQVPAHFGRPGAPASASSGRPTASEAGGAAPTRKGKGKAKGFRPGANAEILDEQRTEEAVTAVGLLAMAQRVENGGGAPATEGSAEAATPEPVQVAKLLRQAAARIGALEKHREDLGQTLRAVNSLTGRSLAAAGLLSTDDMPTTQIVDASGDGEPRGQSYMIKKGDEDVQEAHRAAAQMRPTTTSGGTTGGGGALSGQAKTREEMEQARRERLARLEQAQADKKREQDEAAAKTRARDALFQQPFASSAKPLGKL